MGSSHHALEDYGCLLTLPHMRAFVPAFDSDVNTMIPMLMQCKGPVYLRLGLSEEPKDWPMPAYAPWRRLLRGNGPILAGVGPLVGGMLTALQQLNENVRPEVWLITELPITNVPDEFIASVRRSSPAVRGGRTHRARRFWSDADPSSGRRRRGPRFLHP